MTTRERAIGDFEHSTLRQAIVLLVAFKIVGILLFVDPNGLQAFDLPKSLLSRALSFLIAGLLAIAFLRFGLAIVPRTRLHLAVGVFLAANLASGLLAENKYLALFGENERYLGLTFLADMLVLYVAVAVGVKE
ncbi:MAG: hypothetical protein M3T56_13910, partial [Chloroflexota bacterium]|nr:hypothetical protein [Chloroflexota bacterium]